MKIENMHQDMSAGTKEDAVALETNTEPTEKYNDSQVHHENQPSEEESGDYVLVHKSDLASSSNESPAHSIYRTTLIGLTFDLNEFAELDSAVTQKGQTNYSQLELSLENKAESDPSGLGSNLAPFLTRISKKPIAKKEGRYSKELHAHVQKESLAIHDAMQDPNAYTSSEGFDLLIRSVVRRFHGIGFDRESRSLMTETIQQISKHPHANIFQPADIADGPMHALQRAIAEHNKGNLQSAQVLYIFASLHRKRWTIPLIGLRMIYQQDSRLMTKPRAHSVTDQLVSRLQEISHDSKLESYNTLMLISRTDAVAQCMLGVVCFYGWGAQKSEADAAIYFLRSAELGCVISQAYLGSLYIANSLSYSASAGFHWLRKASEVDCVIALVNLGFSYFLSPLSTSVTQVEAVRYLRRAAEMDHERAWEYLGYCCERGFLDGDLLDQSECMKKSMLLGNPSALCWFEDDEDDDTSCSIQ